MKTNETTTAAADSLGAAIAALEAAFCHEDDAPDAEFAAVRSLATLPCEPEAVPKKFRFLLEGCKRHYGRNWRIFGAAHVIGPKSQVFSSRKAKFFRPLAMGGAL